MKRILTLVLTIGMVCALLSGCGVSESVPVIGSDVSSAKTVFDLAEYMTATKKNVMYSELEDDDGLTMYFDLLTASEGSYFIFDRGGEKYALFLYRYSDYGAVLSAVTDMEKKYSENALSVTPVIKTKETDNFGDMPDISYASCAVRLEHDIDGLTVDGIEYSPYSGGIVRVGDKVGAADEQLDIVLPVEYEIIRPLDDYYFYSGSDGSGILDKNYKPILKPVYANVFPIDGGKFVVMREKGEGSGLDNYEIGIVDSGDEPVSEFIDGFIDGTLSFKNNAKQVIFGRMSGSDYLKGVIDDELNVVIEPEYSGITVFSEENDDMFYVVESTDGEFAVFDKSGEQKTEFTNTSVYDVQTEYYQKLGISN